MLSTIKSQLTDENETDDDGDSTGRGLASVSGIDTAEAKGDDAAGSTTTNEEAPAEPTIELDEVFGLLKNRRRRDVLRHLVETSEELRLGELAERIAARECGKDVSQINSQERKRVYVGLYQCHLPKLADIGVINYNKPRGTIERGPNFDQITHYLPADESPSKRAASDHPLMESLSNIMSTGRLFQ